MNMPTTTPKMAKHILLHGWLDFFSTESITGNGLQILVFGLWLCLQYVLFIALRVLLVLIMPISAPLLAYRARNYEATKPRRKRDATGAYKRRLFNLSKN